MIKMIDSGASDSKINALLIHSDASKTLQKYYYRANCIELMDKLLEPNEVYRVRFQLHNNQ